MSTSPNHRDADGNVTLPKSGEKARAENIVFGVVGGAVLGAHVGPVGAVLGALAACKPSTKANPDNTG